MAKKWHTYYKSIENRKAHEFVEDGIELVKQFYGEPIIPIKSVHLCYSQPIARNSELEKNFRLCELVDEEAGEFAIYLSQKPMDYAFHGTLAHEIAHLLNPRIYDAYIEGLNTCFAEKLLKKWKLDWSGWASHFQQDNEPFYARTYHMMKEIDEFLNEGGLSNFFDFVEPVDDGSGNEKINIEAWLHTLPRGKQDVVRFLIFKYAAPIEVARRESHSAYHFTIPRLCSCPSDS